MKKKSYITILLTMLISMIGAKAFAYDFAVANSDGVTIYYEWVNSEKTEVAVTYYSSSSDNGRYTYKSNYSGNIMIPESVVYEGNAYNVTSIGDNAFYECRVLTFVTIPNCVTSIGKNAFQYCI